MTNEEKYKTPQERDRAFTTLCIGQNCKKCQCFNKGANCHAVEKRKAAREEGGAA